MDRRDRAHAARRVKFGEQIASNVQGLLRHVPRPPAILAEGDGAVRGEGSAWHGPKPEIGIVHLRAGYGRVECGDLVGGAVDIGRARVDDALLAGRDGLQLWHGMLTSVVEGV